MGASSGDLRPILVLIYPWQLHSPKTVPMSMAVAEAASFICLKLVCDIITL